MLIYFVAPNHDTAEAKAKEWGWQQIAHGRFVNEAKDEIRIVSRFAELLPLAEQTPMLKASDYEDGPRVKLERTDENWTRDKKDFAAFVESGRGLWVDYEKLMETRTVNVGGIH